MKHPADCEHTKHDPVLRHWYRQNPDKMCAACWFLHRPWLVDANGKARAFVEVSDG